MQIICSSLVYISQHIPIYPKMSKPNSPARNGMILEAVLLGDWTALDHPLLDQAATLSLECQMGLTLK